MKLTNSAYFLIILFACCNCIRPTSNPYKIATDVIEKTTSTSSICVSEILIHPLYEQFEESGAISSFYNKSSSNYKEENGTANPKDALHYFEHSFNYNRDENRHINLRPCVDQKRTIFFTNLNENVLYALAIDTDRIVGSNSKVVTFRGRASAFLFLFSEDKSAIDEYARVEVQSFVPAQ